MNKMKFSSVVAHIGTGFMVIIMSPLLLIGAPIAACMDACAQSPVVRQE